MRKPTLGMKLCLMMSAAALGVAQVRAADRSLSLICGVENVEDMIDLPDSPWIIGGGVGNGFLQSGALHLINRETRTASRVALDMTGATARKPYDRCPGPTSAAKFSAHGLDLRANLDGTHTLYVVNHGDREAVEVFEVKTTKREPVFTWIGCIVSPDTALPNAVAVGRDGSVVISASFASDKPIPGYAQLAKLSEAEGSEGKKADQSQAQYGAVFSWTRDAGWRKIPNSELLINNGIQLSADGKGAFVNSWLGQKLVYIPFDASAGGRREVGFDFKPDNLRRSPGGKLIATGQIAEFSEIAECVYKGAVCSVDYKAVEIDPKTLKVSILYEGKGTKDFGAASVAIKASGALWIGSLHSRCIARLPLSRNS